MVDRHSNFKFETQKKRSIKWALFHFLSRKTISLADATIVTNEYLKRYCDELGGKALVLQDKIPSMESTGEVPGFMCMPHLPQVVCITMFDDDEPIKEILTASRRLYDFVFYFTGNYRKMFCENAKAKAAGDLSIFLGFVSENEYRNLLSCCDVVLVLTVKEYILNCGAYEAVSLCKPVVVANTDTLRDYFGNSVVYADPQSPGSIAKGVKIAFDERGSSRMELEKLKTKLLCDWATRFQAVSEYCDQLATKKAAV